VDVKNIEPMAPYIEPNAGIAEQQCISFNLVSRVPKMMVCSKNKHIGLE